VTILFLTEADLKRAGFSERSIRRAITLKRDKGMCKDCKTKQSLHVHHNDRDSDNNRLRNLVTLCVVCHGKRHTPDEETKKRMKASQILRFSDPAERSRLSERQKGRKHSAETKRKMSLSRKGWNPSTETRKKMGLSQKGRKHTQESRRKMSDAGKGRVLSDEHKARIGVALTDSWKRKKKP